MPNPAIVLMTDPSRCSLGDVHYLVQALIEMQQMGDNAAPQAFCDHPAAARDFIDAYVHAYPQLVLQDEELPTPDHLQSLITNGQIGAFARPPEMARSLALPNGLTRPSEQNGLNPIVVLTLGSSQVLIDALKQSPAVKESIRLIEIGQDGADSAPTSVADAVAVHGLETPTWEHDGLAADRTELDDLAGPAQTDPASLTPRHDPMNLDVVETDKAPVAEPPAYEHETAQATVAPESAATTAQAQPAAVEPSTGLQDSGPAAAEPPVEVASPTATGWPSDPAAVVTNAPIAADQVLSPQPTAPDVSSDDQAGQETPGSGEASAKDDDGDQDADADEGPDHAGKGTDHADEDIDHDPDDGGKAHGADDKGDDVDYPPVGSLVAGADVHYPALDQDDAHGALHELAAAILDDGMVDPDMAFHTLEAHPDDGPAGPAHEEAIVTVHSADNVVTIEDFYGVLDQQDEETLADTGGAPHVHHSDL